MGFWPVGRCGFGSRDAKAKILVFEPVFGKGFDNE
jgi:hypothetical protein